MQLVQREYARGLGNEDKAQGQGELVAKHHGGLAVPFLQVSWVAQSTTPLKKGPEGAATSGSTAATSRGKARSADKLLMCQMFFKVFATQLPDS